MLIALIAVAGFAGCSKEDDKPTPGTGDSWGEVTFTVNGDGFSNETITIKGLLDENHNADEGVYFVRSKFTSLSVDSDTLPNNRYKYSFDLNFKGNGTGKQKTGEVMPQPNFLPLALVTFSVTLFKNGQPRDYIYNHTYGQPGIPIWTTATPGSVTITKYEGQGGRIEGTFEGKLIYGDVIPEIPITITNGRFWFKRGEDNPF